MNDDLRETESQRTKHVPNPRPPKTWRERFLHALPHYTGPHNVGYLEIELPVRQPRFFSHIKRNHEHALRLDTVLFSIYYPADLTKGPPKSRVPWLPRPMVQTCKGYAKFLSIPHLPVTAYIATTSMFTKLPAFRNASLGPYLPDTGAEAGAPAADASSSGGEPPFPCIIFSHGLGGSRTMYSSICGELASYGFVVVALEHRDGSGARTYVNIPDDQRSPELTEGPNPPRKDREKGYYMVDYIFPRDNAQDTSPKNAKGVDVELRTAQVEMRLAEIEEAFHVLKMINSGQGTEVTRLNLRRKGNAGSSSCGLDGVDWQEWQGRFALEQVTAMGHSFGGATTVQILRLQERFSWIGQGILLDVWGPATPDSKSRVTKPLLSIGSEAFMHWQGNLDRVNKICEEARSEKAPCWMLTIRGSTHLSWTDFAMLYPTWMALLMKTIVHPNRALRLTMTTTLEFLQIVLPQKNQGQQDQWANEGLLERAESQTDIPLEHRPDEKWIAARLKIDHEFSLRVARWFRWKKRRRSGMPTDASGKPLAGLMDWDEGSEIWVHLTPDRPHNSITPAVPADAL